MSLSEKYPNLTGEESLQQIVREALSTVGIVNDAKVTGVIVDLFEELAAPFKEHLDSLRSELKRLLEQNVELSTELAALKPPLPPPPVTPPEPAAAPEAPIAKDTTPPKPAEDKKKVKESK